MRSGPPPASFDAAHKLMGWAERIVILGFGFDKVNCSRLGIMDYANSTDPTGNREIIATLFNVCPVDERRIKATHPECQTGGAAHYPGENVEPFIEWFDGDALSFMEKHGIEDPEIV